MSTEAAAARPTPLRSFALTDPGMRREANEDNFCARPDLGLFVVADGLGGHPGGQLASRIVSEAIEATIAGAFDPADVARYGIQPSNDIERRARDAFHVAYQRLTMIAGEAAELYGMATTVAGVLVDVTHHDPHAIAREVAELVNLFEQAKGRDEGLRGRMAGVLDTARLQFFVAEAA